MGQDLLGAWSILGFFADHALDKIPLHVGLRVHAGKLVRFVLVVQNVGLASERIAES